MARPLHKNEFCKRWTFYISIKTVIIYRILENEPMGKAPIMVKTGKCWCWMNGKIQQPEICPVPIFRVVIGRCRHLHTQS